MGTQVLQDKVVMEGWLDQQCEHHSEQIALLENDPGNQTWWNMAAI